MIQALPSAGYEFVLIISDEILATADDSRFGCFVDVDLEDRHHKNKTRYFHLSPESKKVISD